MKELYYKLLSRIIVKLAPKVQYYDEIMNYWSHADYRIRSQSSIENKLIMIDKFISLANNSHKTEYEKLNVYHDYIAHLNSLKETI